LMSTELTGLAVSVVFMLLPPTLALWSPVDWYADVDPVGVLAL
jgi:hypothetical protein